MIDTDAESDDCGDGGNSFVDVGGEGVVVVTVMR